jgi:hypothetical protein
VSAVKLDSRRVKLVSYLYEAEVKTVEFQPYELFTKFMYLHEFENLMHQLKVLRRIIFKLNLLIFFLVLS